MTAIIELLKAFLFGIIEGITEWLPISSTGHLILLEEFVKFSEVSEGFFSMFEVVIQLGAILAVVVIFFDKLNPFSVKNGELLRILRRDRFILWVKIAVACLPAAVIGVLFDDIIDELFYNPLTVAIMLVVVGIGFIAVERRNRSKKPVITDLDSIDIKTALLIGCFQTVAAVLPGTSRSGATILGGLMLGVGRTAAAEFTFFLGIPVMLGASLLKLVKFGFAFTGIELVILAVGCVTAFAVSLFCIRFLMDYIKRHSFAPFGVYRILLGAAALIYWAVKLAV